MRKRFAMVAALLLIVTSAGIYVFGDTKDRMVEQCKSLRIGAPQHEILTVLGKPARTAKVTQGRLVLERMFFAPSTVLPDSSAQPIYVDVDTMQRQAIRIVCNEEFRRQSSEIEALEKKGVH